MKTRMLLVSVQKSLAECVKILNPEGCKHQRSILCFRECSKLMAFGWKTAVRNVRYYCSASFNLNFLTCTG